MTFVGAIPMELQPGFTFAGAIATGARQSNEAAALLRFLVATDKEPTLLKAGLTPAAAR